MSFSKLKYQIQTTRIKHEREKEELYSKHQKELKILISQCRHVYENGNSAKVIWEGTNRMGWGYRCEICDCKL